MTTTTYKIHDGRGQALYITDTAEAEGYARRGFRVTAVTTGQ